MPTQTIFRWEGKIARMVYRWILFYLVFLLILSLLVVGLTAFKLANPHTHWKDWRPRFAEGIYQKDRLLGWRLIPNLNVSNESGKSLFVSNRFGFRGNEFEIPPKGAAMLVGDSYVQGLYLDEKETISKRLQEKIGAYVYNFGISGYSADQEFIVTREALSRFQTPWVFQLFFLNDLTPILSSEIWGIRKPRFEIVAGKVIFERLHTALELPDNGTVFEITGDPTRKSQIMRNVNYNPGYLKRLFSLSAYHFRVLGYSLFHPVAALQDLREGFVGRPPLSYPAFELEVAGYSRTTYKDPKALDSLWNIAFQFFSKTKELAEVSGAQYVVLFIPERTQVKFPNANNFAPQEKFMEYCDEQRLQCIDPRHSFIERQKIENPYFGDDPHLSPYGAELVAEILAEYIQTHSLRPH